MRTDRAIKANTVVFMGEYLLIRRSSCERRQKRRRSNRARHQTEIGSAVYDPVWDELALNAPHDDIGMIPDLRSDASLRIVSVMRAAWAIPRSRHRKRCRRLACPSVVLTPCADCRDRLRCGARERARRLVFV